MAMGLRRRRLQHMPSHRIYSKASPAPEDDQPDAVCCREAIRKATEIGLGAPIEGTFSALADAWLKRQKDLPDGTEGKRAESTLAENERELAMLKKGFGHMMVADMEKADAYAYLDACLMARDKAGNPRPRPEKGNKEIALARVVLEYGVRVRAIPRPNRRGCPRRPRGHLTAGASCTTVSAS